MDLQWLQQSNEWLGTVALLLLAVVIVCLISVVFLKRQLQTARNGLGQQTHKNEQLAQQQSDLLESSERLNTRIEEASIANQQQQIQLAASQRENELLTASSVELQAQLQTTQSEYGDLKSNHCALEAKTRAESLAMQEKLELLQQSRQQMASEFELLANKIFEEKTQRFNKNSQQQLDATLLPLKSQLDAFRKRVDDVYTQDSKDRHLLQDQIKQLRAESLRISEDANNLTRALKHDNKAQGNWGELTLVRALEMCGLREPQEYQTQTAYKSDDNSRQIPDVIVHLPGGKDIIIDSKVSLLAYSRYFEAKTDEQRSEAAKQHLQSVRQHIKQLGEKSYQHLQGVTTLDYVMLYIPIEGASAMALQSHHGLWEEAYSKNIVLVSPTNLLAILRSVETIWRHEKQNKNAEEIARQAGNLHDKFIGLIASLEKVGENLARATNAYETAHGQLASGKGNLISRVQKLEKLGAKTKSEIPKHLQLAADADNDVVPQASNTSKSNSLKQTLVEKEPSVD